jgi:hypothetical protein
MSEFPPRYPSVPTLTTNRTPVGNTDANQKPMLIDDFSTNEPPLSWMMFEQANLRKQLVELNNQLAEAKAEIVRLREENNDLKSSLMNVLFSEVSHVEITEFTREKE